MAHFLKIVSGITYLRWQKCCTIVARERSKKCERNSPAVTQAGSEEEAERSPALEQIPLLTPAHMSTFSQSLN